MLTAAAIGSRGDLKWKRQVLSPVWEGIMMRQILGNILIFLTLLMGCGEDKSGIIIPPGDRPRRNYGQPAWGPSDWIVFGHTPYDASGQPVDSSGLWLVHPDGSGKRPLTLLREVGDFGSPDWSPDGQWIVAHKDGQIYRIAVTRDSVQVMS